MTYLPVPRGLRREYYTTNPLTCQHTLCNLRTCALKKQKGAAQNGPLVNCKLLFLSLASHDHDRDDDSARDQQQSPAADQREADDQLNRNIIRNILFGLYGVFRLGKRKDQLAVRKSVTHKDVARLGFFKALKGAFGDKIRRVDHDLQSTKACPCAGG